MTDDILEHQTEQAESIRPEESQSNPELDALVDGVDQEAGGEAPAAPTVLMTPDDARAIVALGAAKLTLVVGDLTKTRLEPDGTQVEKLANQVHPVLLKYAAALENPPPWLAALLQYRAEAVALYAITVFGFSLRSAVLADKARQRQAEQRKREGASHGDQPE